MLNQILRATLSFKILFCKEECIKDNLDITCKQYRPYIVPYLQRKVQITTNNFYSITLC